MSFFALGIALVPFAVTSTDHAAEFYGAFVAAIVAAGAIVGTTALQAELSRREKAADRRQAAIAEMIELYVWLDVLGYEFHYVWTVLGGILSIDPPVAVTARLLRSHVKPDVRLILRDRLMAASRLPSPLNLSITHALHRADGALDTVAYQPVLADDAIFPRNQVEFRQQLAEYYMWYIRLKRSELGLMLVNEGAIASIDQTDLQAMAHGHPVMPVMG